MKKQNDSSPVKNSHPPEAPAPQPAPAEPAKATKSQSVAPTIAKTNRSLIWQALTGILLCTTIGLGAYAGWDILKNGDLESKPGSGSDNIDDVETPSGISDAESSDDDECPECDVCIESPEYVLNLGDTGHITIPQGWHVSLITSDYTVSPDDLLSLLPEPQNSGHYPIHQATEIELTNDVSTITISSNESMIMGPFGAESSPLEDGYTVFAEPTGGWSDQAGGARRLADDGRYYYELIWNCDEPPVCGDGYAVINGEVPLDLLVFEGSDEDLSIADGVFIEAFVEHVFNARIMAGE